MLAEIVWNTDMVAMVMIFSVPLISIIGAFWVKLERARSEDELKRSMVERGMSVEEIERVLAAKSSKN